MNAQDFMMLAPAKIEAAADFMNTVECRDIAKELESLATRAAERAAYLEERYGYGCGDQGHQKAATRFNRAGRMVHCKVFRHNAFVGCNI